MTLIPDGARFQGSQMRNQQEAIENAAAITLLQIVRLKTCTFIIQVAYWVYFCITSSVDIQINNYRTWYMTLCIYMCNSLKVFRFGVRDEHCTRTWSWCACMHIERCR